MSVSTTWADRLAATSSGSGARCVVLGHGIGTDQNSWQPQAEALVRAGMRVLRFDFAGATPRTQALFHSARHSSLYGFAEDLTMLMGELDLRDAVYVGHSLGAMAGILAAAASPGLFRAVVAIGASACYVDDPSTDYVGGYSRADVDAVFELLRSNYVAWANGFARSMVGSDGPHLSASEFTRALLGLRPDIAQAMLRATLLCDHRDEMRALRTPLYMIHATRDPAVPESAARWLARHANARRLVLIDAHGHLPHMTTPCPVAQALLQCLEDAFDA